MGLPRRVVHEGRAYYLRQELIERAESTPEIVEQVIKKKALPTGRKLPGRAHTYWTEEECVVIAAAARAEEELYRSTFPLLALTTALHVKHTTIKRWMREGRFPAALITRESRTGRGTRISYRWKNSDREELVALGRKLKQADAEGSDERQLPLQPGDRTGHTGPGILEEMLQEADEPPPPEVIGVGAVAPRGASEERTSLENPKELEVHLVLPPPLEKALVDLLGSLTSLAHLRIQWQAENSPNMPMKGPDLT